MTAPPDDDAIAEELVAALFGQYFALPPPADSDPVSVQNNQAGIASVALLKPVIELG